MAGHRPSTSTSPSSPVPTASTIRPVKRRVSELLKELAFERYRSYRVEALSGGTRQKLNLALVLMHKPELLLLDEPYSGFDREAYLR
jgi:ABC-2 type transport system ATP-binding protein